MTLLWGVFCACSWTWCIGMYLPRILIDRWGWWGFIAFALPNVMGCTAFGYILKNRARSEAMIAQHSAAMLCFSSATIAYHVFFIVWLFESLVRMPESDVVVPLVAAGIVFTLAGVFSFLNNRDWLGVSVLVYAISLLAFWRLGADALESIRFRGEQNLALLALAIPAILFGFLLCPYVDLTFHRAVQHTPSKHSFAVFGATFSIMIVLSCAIWFDPQYLNNQWLPAIVIAHLLAQSVFTMGAHMREIRVSRLIRTETVRVIALFAPLAAALALHVARAILDSPAVGENIYLTFLTLYGSLFPMWFVLRAIRARHQLAK